MKADENAAKWNTKYMTGAFGKNYKISEMSMRQVNQGLRQCKTNLTVIRCNMDSLYQRRHVLMHQQGEYSYQRKNAKQKIIQHLGLTTQVDIEGEQRYKQILLTAITLLEKGHDLSLIKALLEQARDEE
tara:strand:+ start:283 stop:669 length:387 start_codon:yes stop_codon:yes gene_type:complete